jgi:glycosyl transferase family 25
MLKLFVINLASSILRFEQVKQRLSELDLDFERFDAVDGRKVPHPLFDRYDDSLRKRYRRTEMSAGEKGCFASHFLLWEKSVALNEPIIVMEDDVVIDDSFVESVHLAENIIEDIPYLRLAGTSLKKSPYQHLGKVGSFELTDHERGPTGTLCYVIHPHAAKKLIDGAAHWFLAVDDYMDRYWEHGVDCFSLMPFPVRVGTSHSDIQRNDKDRRLWSILLREVFRRIEIIRRGRYHQKVASDKSIRVKAVLNMMQTNVS